MSARLIVIGVLGSLAVGCLGPGIGEGTETLPEIGDSSSEATLTCTPNELAASRCVAGDLFGFDDCGTQIDLLEACESLGPSSTCVTLSENSAECTCVEHWQGEGCTVCPDNFDSERGCAFCQDGWTGESCDACVRYVAHDSTAPAPDGLTWDNAFLAPQAAVNAAAAAIDTLPEADRCQVWLKGGIYYTYKTADADRIELSPGIELYGGFTGAEAQLNERTPEAEPTILSGRSAESDTDQTVNIVRPADDTRLDTLTFEGVSGYGEPQPGAVYAQNSYVQIHNCVFRDNIGGWGPAGVNFQGDGILPSRVSNCTFEDNQDGTAISNFGNRFEIVDSVFRRNEGSSAGAVKATQSGLSDNPSIISRCIFEDNDAIGGALAGAGGAVLNSQSYIRILDSSFRGNTAALGGAIYNDPNGDVTIKNSIFALNHSNAVDGYGAAIYSALDSSVHLHNNTFWNNVAENTAGATIFFEFDDTHSNDVKNNILWGNQTGTEDLIFSDSYDPAAVLHNIIENAQFYSINNIVSDPFFVAPEAGDFHLMENSPAIDAADYRVAPELDMEGNPRVDIPSVPNTGDGALPYVDIGAYEFQP